MFFMFIWGLRPAGHHAYFTHNGREYCVAVTFFTLFFVLPLFPISGPRLIINPNGCERSYRFLRLQGCCFGGHFVLACLIAFLQFITLGLFRFVRIPACNKEDILAHIVHTPAPPPPPQPGQVQGYEQAPLVQGIPIPPQDQQQGGLYDTNHKQPAPPGYPNAMAGQGPIV